MAEKRWDAVCFCKKRGSVKADGHRVAVKIFRDQGWKIGRDWAECPKCLKKKAKKR